MCHNPYFNRWFSAIKGQIIVIVVGISHNPYFNRWFSAILSTRDFLNGKNTVTILILIDGFLQLDENYGIYEPIKKSQSLF